MAITKAFKNRKIESEFLRGTFPAGFAISRVDSASPGKQKSRGSLSYLSVLQNRIIYMGPFFAENTAILTQSGKQSFISWTKGSSYNAEEASTDLTGDPYAHVAGPFFQDIMRRGSSQQGSIQPSISDNSLCLLSTGPAKLETRKTTVKMVL